MTTAGSQQPDHYAVLGVRADATPTQITHAYRALARALHPDTAPATGTVARFTAVTTAYVVLRDPARRATYDQSRAALTESATPPRAHPRTTSPQPPTYLIDITDTIDSIDPTAQPILRVGPTRVSPLPPRDLPDADRRHRNS